MQLDELQSVRDRERQTDKLQQLRESFYVEAGEFIQQLRAERDRAAERADDPFDAPEVNRLTDEINTAEQTVEAIYEKRVGKIVKAASFAAADLPAESDGMTQEEQELFDQLVADIKQNRNGVLDVLAGDAPTDAPASDTGAPANDDAGSPPVAGRSATDDAAAPPTDDGRDSTPGLGDGADRSSPQSDGTDRSPPPEPDPEADPGVAAADLMGGEGSTPPPGQDAGRSAADDARSSDRAEENPEQAGEKLRNDGGDVEAAARPQTGSTETAPARTRGDETESGPEPPAIDRRTVRVTDDVDTFVGSDDRDYDLRRDDVVTLPAANAEILIDRDAAEQL
jgi:DNA replication factor GINS